METFIQEPQHMEVPAQEPSLAATPDAAPIHIFEVRRRPLVVEAARLKATQQESAESLDTDNLSSEETGQQTTGLPENVGRWTDEEHQLFLQGLELYGKTWKKIAELIPSRTVVQIRTHAQKYFLKIHRAEQNAAKICTDSDGAYSVPMTRKRFRTRQVAALERQAQEDAQCKERPMALKQPALYRKQSNHSEATTCSSMSEGPTMMYYAETAEAFEQQFMFPSMGDSEPFLGSENFDWVDNIIGGDDDDDLQFHMLLEELSTTPLAEMPLPFLDDIRSFGHECNFASHPSTPCHCDDHTFAARNTLPQFHSPQQQPHQFQQYHQPQQLQFHSQYQQQYAQQQCQPQQFQQQQQQQHFHHQQQRKQQRCFHEQQYHAEPFAKQQQEYAIYQTSTPQDRRYMSQQCDHSTPPQFHQQFQQQPAQQYQPQQQQYQPLQQFQAMPSMSFAPQQENFDDFNEFFA